MIVAMTGWASANGAIMAAPISSRTTKTRPEM